MEVYQRMDEVFTLEKSMKSSFFVLFRYSENGEAISVKHPEENILVFDVETLVCEGNFAVLAVALSPKHWFVISLVDDPNVLVRIEILFFQVFMV